MQTSNIVFQYWLGIWSTSRDKSKEEMYVYLNHLRYQSILMIQMI